MTPAPPVDLDQPSRRDTAAALRRRPHGRAVKSAVTLLLVLALGLAARSLLLTSPTTTVPDIPAGSTVTAAVAALRAADLVPGRRTAPHPRVPAGRVVGTDPAAGTERRRDSFVTLLVSSGRARTGAAEPGSGTGAGQP